MTIFAPIGKYRARIAACVVCLGVFLATSTVVPQILGNNLAELNLNNSGALNAGGSITNFVKNPPKNLLDLIASHESGGDYNSAYEGSKIKPPKPLTEMTVQEVMDWQNRSVNAGSASSAAGRYQIIGSTMKGLVKEMGIDPTKVKFDQNMQDQMATVLMQRRGLDKFLKGEMSQQDFMKNLALEWASLPKDNSGRAAYGGVATNPTMALVSPSVVNTVLADARNKGITPEEKALYEVGVAGERHLRFMLCFHAFDQHQFARFVQQRHQPRQDRRHIRTMRGV